MATPSNQFRLKLFFNTPYNFTINWGDGSSEVFNQTTSALQDLAGLTHTYATSGIYDISIIENAAGGFPRIFFNGVTNTSPDNDDVKVIDIIEWGSLKFTNMADAFEGCINLRSVQTDNESGSLSGVSNFSNAWYGCSSLKNFSKIDTKNGTNFLNCWRDCFPLISFPLIDTSKCTNFSSAWSNCTSLTSFPLIDTSIGNNFGGSWSNCSSLSSFPLINTSNGLIFTNAWNNCVSLESFPEIDTSKASILNFAWYNCKNLKTFPHINTLSATNLARAWNLCINLTSFPLINTENVTNFISTWDSCFQLSSTHFPQLNFSKMLSGTNCFAGVKLTTTSYSSLLTSICATNFNNNVIFHGGNSTYNTPASAARSFLVNTRGWTITDGGYQLGT